MQRIVLTLILLPPAIVGVALLASGLLGAAAPDVHVSAALSFVFFCALFVYLSVALVALPILVLLARRGRVTAWSSALAGVAAALLMPSLLAAAQLWDSRLRLAYRIEQVLDLWPYALVGAASGLAFWVFALWRNPFVALWNARTAQPAVRSAA